MENQQQVPNKKEKKSIISKWKSIESGKRFFIVVIIIVIIFLGLMPKLYKSLGNIGNRIKDLFHSKDSYSKITCSQTAEDSNNKTTVKAVIFYDVNGLKKEEYTITVKALTEIGKNDLKERQEIYQQLEESYKKYDGFTTKTKLKKDTISFSYTTDYNIIDYKKIAEEYNEETGEGVNVEFKLNQNIDSVKQYYESVGLTCTAKK